MLALMAITSMKINIVATGIIIETNWNSSSCNVINSTKINGKFIIKGIVTVVVILVAMEVTFF